MSDIFECSAVENEVGVEIALQWTDSYSENVLCYTNNIPQKDGGTHLAGFRGSLTRVLKAFIKKENAKKTPIVIVLDNVRSAHNVGAIFRTSDAFLIEKIFLCGITPCPPNNEIPGLLQYMIYNFRKKLIYHRLLLEKNILYLKR